MTTDRIRSLDELQPERIPLLILDFDGVIYDLVLDWPAIKNDLAEHCRSKHGSRISFQPLADGRRRVREELGLEALEEVDDLLAEREHSSLSVSSARPDFLRLIERSGTADLAICSSNGRKVVEAALDHTRCRERFSCIVTREDVDRLKPHPDGLVAVLDALERPVTDAIFVGDRETDRQAGAAAGISTLLLEPIGTERP